jgi:c-di-GMP-binding flagellar brake protein YcgR
MKQSNSQYQVTNSARKIHLLRALAENRSLLTIILPDLKEPVTSALIEVNHDHILLDELIPHSANLAFNPGTPFSVISKLKGIPVRFQSIVQSIDHSHDGIISYACHLPETVSYQQKRRDYRLHSRGVICPSILVSIAGNPSDGDDVENQQVISFEVDPVEPTDYSAPSLSGKVTDISMGGASAEFMNMPAWTDENSIMSCTIELNEGPMLYSRARICHTHESIKGRRNALVHTLGLEFLSLNEINKRQLQQWIYNAERKRLRH